MTKLNIPIMAYRPTGTTRPGAWKWHLQKSTGANGGANWIRTVCGLTLERTEMGLIVNLPTGSLCRQCLGALEEENGD